MSIEDGRSYSYGAAGRRDLPDGLAMVSAGHVAPTAGLSAAARLHSRGSEARGAAPALSRAPGGFVLS
ncbi:hypothetical protein ACFWHL_37360 [Streptomyces massasporeus]